MPFKSSVRASLSWQTLSLNSVGRTPPADQRTRNSAPAVQSRPFLLHPSPSAKHRTASCRGLSASGAAECERRVCCHLVGHDRPAKGHGWGRVRHFDRWALVGLSSTPLALGSNGFANFFILICGRRLCLVVGAGRPFFQPAAAQTFFTAKASPFVLLVLTRR